MTSVFNPVEELHRQGLITGDVSDDTKQTLGILTEPQVGFIVNVKQRVDAMSAPDVQSQPIEDGQLALAMAHSMGWDRPQVTNVGGEVEGMIQKEDNCLCACSAASGSGSG